MSEELHSVYKQLGEQQATLRAVAESVTSIGADVKVLLADKNRREGSRKAVFAIAAAVGTAAAAGTEAVAALLRHT